MISQAIYIILLYIVGTLREDQPLRLLLNLLFYHFNRSESTYRSRYQDKILPGQTSPWTKSPLGQNPVGTKCPRQNPPGQNPPVYFIFY